MDHDIDVAGIEPGDMISFNGGASKYHVNGVAEDNRWLLIGIGDGHTLAYRVIDTTEGLIGKKQDIASVNALRASGSSSWLAMREVVQFGFWFPLRGPGAECRLTGHWPTGELNNSRGWAKPSWQPEDPWPLPSQEVLDDLYRPVKVHGVKTGKHEGRRGE